MVFSLHSVSQARQPALPELSHPCPPLTGKNMGSLSSVPLEPLLSPQAQQWYQAKKMLLTHLQGSSQVYNLTYSHCCPQPAPRKKRPAGLLSPGCDTTALAPAQSHRTEGPFACPVTVTAATFSRGQVLWHWKAQHPGTADKQLNSIHVFGFITFVNVGAINHPNLEKVP